MARNKPLALGLCLSAIFVIVALIAISAVVLNGDRRDDSVTFPPLTGSPTSLSPLPTLRPTRRPTSSPVPVPTVTPMPTTSTSPAPTSLPVTSCKCGNDEQPIYDTFPHPAHTDASFAVFNFYNDNAIDNAGNNMTVWITVQVTADARMASESAGLFRTSYTYVYLDAQRLRRGERYTLTIPKEITVNGRLPGGRIVVYYEDPASFDQIRNEPRYAGHYPVVTNRGNIVPITTTNGLQAIPSPSFQQAIEFTLDVNIGEDANTRGFIDYDLSAVDLLSMPVYVFGGYDTRTLPGATTGNSNNGFPCGKTYIGCKTPAQTVEGCPTQVAQRTLHGTVCLASFVYCQLQGSAIENITRWNAYCHFFDDLAAGFGITQERLDFFRLCNDRLRAGDYGPPIPEGCPDNKQFLPDIRTPTAAIYGCDGILLLENHCLLNGARFANSTLDGTQCSAINRGLCFTPNYTHVPLPSGLSCARNTSCVGFPTECLIPCYQASCSGALCASYPNAPNCVDYDAPISKSKESLCNDSTPNPYTYGLRQNEYAAWAHTKGERFYTFSLDEEVGGGNQQCLFSTQLDVVVYPSCKGRLP